LNLYKKIIHKTPFGSVAVAWKRITGTPKVLRVLLSKPGLVAEDQLDAFYPDLKDDSCKEIESIARAIAGMLEGNDVAIPLEAADMASCPEFQQSVLRAEYRIPRGCVSTYTLIAAHVGKPRGARAVGNALARNPFPLIVPCHRAIRSDLHLGGYQGGLAMKRKLLKMEGIRFDAAGRVICSRFHYERLFTSR
jgi:methylated-DNA-[protein]-cysteine S-methyltransferase